MALELTKKNVVHIIAIVQDYQREGNSLNAFLTDFYLSNKEWKKFVRKNKKLRTAIDDGLVYYKAYWERSLAKAMKSKRGNAALEKLAYENALGWASSSRDLESGKNDVGMYKVILDLGPEEGNEDKIIPEKGDSENGKE